MTRDERDISQRMWGVTCKKEWQKEKKSSSVIKLEGLVVLDNFSGKMRKDRWFLFFSKQIINFCSLNGQLWCYEDACMRAQLLSSVPLFETQWTIARQAPLSMGVSRQEYWSGLPCSPGDLPHPGIDPTSLMSPGLAGGFFTTSTTWEAPFTSLKSFILQVSFPLMLLISSGSVDERRIQLICPV